MRGITSIFMNRLLAVFIPLLPLAPLPLPLAAESPTQLPIERATESDWPSRIQAIELKHIEANGIDIAYKIVGDEADPTVLMIMGLGVSHKMWGGELPGKLVDAGYQVVLFDNRDVGGSQRFDTLGDPTIWWEFIKYEFGLKVNAAYDLNDMARDSIGLMDVLQLESAHLVGVSMGGMISQVVAARYPDRVLSLTSIMSTPGLADHLPPFGELDGEVSDSQKDETEEEVKTRLEGSGLFLDAVPRQLMAILKAGDRSEEVKTITVPTLVMHGKDDNVIPVVHGEYTAEIIDGAEFITFDGMEHHISDEIRPQLVEYLVRHLKRQSQPSRAAE